MVKPLYSNLLKYGHLCVNDTQNSAIRTLINPSGHLIIESVSKIIQWTPFVQRCVLLTQRLSNSRGLGAAWGGTENYVEARSSILYFPLS